MAHLTILLMSAIFLEDENVLYKHIQEKYVVQRCYTMKLKSWTEKWRKYIKIEMSYEKSKQSTSMRLR